MEVTGSISKFIASLMNFDVSSSSTQVNKDRVAAARRWLLSFASAALKVASISVKSGGDRDQISSLPVCENKK